MVAMSAFFTALWSHEGNVGAGKEALPHCILGIKIQAY
jgi:hypothetical protein